MRTHHESVHESHYDGDIDEELLLQKLRIIQCKYFDSLLAGSFDGPRLAEEANRSIVVDLEDLVRVVVGGDGLGGFVDVETLDCIFHQGYTPV
jgi:hypothetical protein